MEEESCVPPGFRFHPTEEELVGYYLAKKVASQKIDLEIIQEVDLYRIEPWDLQERCKYGHDEQTEWYFFSYKDRKYPSGTRTNRATAAGFWKATGRDKPVLSRSRVIGMRKTLVFYRGRAPNGRKTDWIMHEYRLQSSEHAPTQEEGWVVCRAFQKPVPNQRPVFPGYATPSYYDHPSTARLHAGALAADHFMDSQLVAGGCFPRLLPSAADCVVDDLESKKHLFTMPQLESPGCNEGGYVVQRSGGGDHADLIQGQGPAASAVDWNFLDSLLSSQFHEPSTSASLQ